MKKIALIILGPLLKDYSSFRRWIGGDWYLTQEPEVSGIAASGREWTRQPVDGDPVIQEEHYPA